MTGRSLCRSKSWKANLLLLLLLVALIPVYTMSLSLSSLIHSKSDAVTNLLEERSFSEPSSCSRRDMIINLCRQGGMMIVATVTAAKVSVDGNQNSASAACLPGDVSKDCIGVYKVPLDDAIMPYVGTPEALKTYAPDLRYVPPIAKPQSVGKAIDILQAQRPISQDIISNVAAGRLEDAGVQVLQVVPQLTTAGRLVVTTAASYNSNDSVPQEGTNAITSAATTSSASEMTIRNIRMMKLEGQFETLLGLWGECDVMIGQGIRGDMGVSAAAQIQILSSLQDASRALDDFILLSLEATKATAK